MSIRRNIKDLIEKLSIEIIMSDRNDPGFLRNIMEILNELKELPENPEDTNSVKIREVAAAMHSYAGKAEVSDAAGLEKTFDILNRVTGAFQIMADGARMAEEISFPAELGIGDLSGAHVENGLNSLYLALCGLSSIASVNKKKQTARAAALFAEIIEKISAKKPVETNSLSDVMNAWNEAAAEIAGSPVTGGAIQTAVTEETRPITEAIYSVPAVNNTPEYFELNADISLLNDFVSEASEHAENAEKNILVLEKERKNKESINSVFRAFHTLKSLSGFLGLDDVNLLVKETENLLAKIRKEELAVTGNVMELLYTSVDLLKKMIKNISISLKTGGKIPRETKLPGHTSDLRNTAEKKEIPVDTRRSDAAADNKPECRQSGISQLKETVKIDSAKLDRLVDTIGEIVIAESMISSGDTAATFASGDYFKNMSHLNKTTKRLHELGLALRLVPLTAVMQKMERIVRDLSKIHNKKINFTTMGEETEIDRSVVEKIHDPLVHMLRNAVDHGLEKTAEERKTAGKNETAEISINAFHRSGNVVIEVSDDGQGLDREKILARGMENGLIDSGAKLTDNEIYNLIFIPGFSTAAVVTDTSGRGVGMDVVRRNVENLKGRMSIETQKGRGTKFSISLPITTAIIEAMIIVINGDKYMLPTLSIVESIKADTSNIFTVAGKGMIINLRGLLLPVFSMKKLFFGIDEELSDVLGKIIVIVEEDDRMAGIVVDGILEQRQIVVKNISESLGKIDGITGCTIMSDGKVGLIIDISGILKSATDREEVKI